MSTHMCLSLHSLLVQQKHGKNKAVHVRDINQSKITGSGWTGMKITLTITFRGRTQKNNMTKHLFIVRLSPEQLCPLPVALVNE